MNSVWIGHWLVGLWYLAILTPAAAGDDQALDIIRRADEVRSPNEPFRYTLTVLEYKNGAVKETNKQVLDISMRFMKPQGEKKADARSLARFIYPPRDKGKLLLSDWYDLWFYTPELRRPIPVSRQQRLLGQISNGDVIVTNFEYAYDAKIEGNVGCGAQQCFRLALVRKSEEVTYPKVIYYVEQDGDNRPYKAAYYSLDDKLLKEVLYQDFRMVLGRMRPMKIVVQETRHSNSYSVMEYSDVRLESLPEYNFTREHLLREAK
ncbi:outer membrane lipoprotein-sorting protein [Aeromonas veronii]|uniref:outer membrane lipoprotein-sorting protein n=1 Tax=Aeromonas veronii TaxID=654 RepID=UPI0031FCE18A